MVKPSSPTAAVTQAMATLQGKRTGIRLANKGDVPVENGMEDADTFWETAKTPSEKPQVAADDEAEEATQRLKDKNAEKTKTKPRFSLAGQDVDDGSEAADDKADHILARVRKGTEQMSPSDMSRVSTAPPTPTSVVTQHEEPPVEEEVSYSPPEGVRASPDEEQEQVVATQASSNSPTASTLPVEEDAPDGDAFPVDDDEDDMIPPPPPEAEDADLSVQEEEEPAQTQEEVDFPADVDDDEDHDDDDDDDDDKEGPGFSMVHDPETPESVRQERLKEENERKKKAKRKKKKDTSSVASKSTAKPKPKRKKKVTYAESPLGYPAGNREYEVVPVSDFKESPEDNGLRRSRRARVKPLAFWKNERPVYEGHHETGELGEAMGLMPVVSGFISAQPTPYKKRKAPAGAANNGKKAKKSSSCVSVADYEDTPFDSRKLRKKYKFNDGEEANVWDEVADDITDQKVVSYADKMVATDLPLPATRKKSEGKVVGKASQAFNVPTDEDDLYVGYIMGSLQLPPTGIKDPESSGACSLSFTVCQAQPKSVEVAFGDPSEQDGELNPKTAQRFLLGPGDMFRVLPGNCYRLENHSKTTECLLSWTIIRPRRNAPGTSS